MNIVAAMSGLLVMVVTIHSLGLFVAIIAGALAGGAVSVLLSALSASGGTSRGNPQESVLADCKRGLKSA